MTLTGSPDDFPVFDAVFEAWFGDEPLPQHRRIARRGGGAAGQRPAASRETVHDMLDGDAAGKDASADDIAQRARLRPPERGRPPVACAASSAIRDLLPVIESRTLVCRSPRGRRIDVARTARAARRTSGETLRLLRKARPDRPRRMLLLVDVSGSMKAQSEATLRFAQLLTRARPKVETFCFGTRLSRVTSDAEAPAAATRRWRRLADLVFDFDGGTRIGASLETFLSVSRYAALVRGAVTLVFSDGLERGDPDAMIHAVTALARLSHRLVWVSPLAADPRYRPLTRAMAGILPVLDALADGSDLPALERLLRRLPAVENAAARRGRRRLPAAPAKRRQ